MLESKPSLLLEMIITHQNNSMSKLVEKLKQEYIKPNLMFDPGYFETQHTCELNSIYIEAPNELFQRKATRKALNVRNI